MSKLTKTDIVDMIAPSVADRPYVERMMMEAFGAIANSVADGEEVSIHGFGIFQPVHMAARNARNPRTGESLIAPAKVKVRFKPAKALQDMVNG
ncbi:MAG: HU family DNA-binding protein [Paracoccaceae bacterium]